MKRKKHPTTWYAVEQSEKYPTLYNVVQYIWANDRWEAIKIEWATAAEITAYGFPIIFEETIVDKIVKDIEKEWEHQRDLARWLWGSEMNDTEVVKHILWKYYALWLIIDNQQLSEK